MENQWPGEHQMDAPEKELNRSFEIRGSENTKELRVERGKDYEKRCHG